MSKQGIMPTIDRLDDPALEDVRLVRAKTAAQLLECCQSTINRWCADGHLERVEIGGARFVTLASIRGAIERGRR